MFPDAGGQDGPVAVGVIGGALELEPVQGLAHLVLIPQGHHAVLKVIAGPVHGAAGGIGEGVRALAADGFLAALQDMGAEYAAPGKQDIEQAGECVHKSTSTRPFDL